jgi:hypothetical protein
MYTWDLLSPISIFPTINWKQRVLFHNAKMLFIHYTLGSGALAAFLAGAGISFRLIENFTLFDIVRFIAIFEDDQYSR